MNILRVPHSAECRHNTVILEGNTIMVCESQPMPITTTLWRTTHIGDGKTQEQTHTFTHEPMDTSDGTKCSHCRMVTNGDLYMVSWPCPSVLVEEERLEANRVRHHLQHAIAERDALRER